MPDYRTTTNMLMMVRRLEQTHAGALPVNQIADELGVHRRTVVRWLKALEAEWVDDDGNPILRRDHRAGEAWAVLTGATTVLSANLFHYAATAAATKHLEVGGGSFLAESAEDVLDRVEAGLPEKQQDYVPTATGWNGSAATCFGHRWPEPDCCVAAMACWSSRCESRTRTGPPTSSSARSNWPNASRPWSLPHGRTACPTTACSRPDTGSETGSFPSLPPTPQSGPA